MHHAMEGHREWEAWDVMEDRVWTRDPRDIVGDPDRPDDGSWRVVGILKDWVGPAVDGNCRISRKFCIVCSS